MNLIGAVTAGAAVAAAILSGVNLYLSGRRELNKWTRESLINVLAIFLDASFKHASACRSIFRLAPTQDEVKRLRKAIIAAHEIENEQLTRLRLLAPPSVVTTAQKLKESEYYLAEPCFLSFNPDDSSDVLIQPVWRCRANFIKAARAALGLREAAGTGSYDKDVQWRNLRHLLAANERERTMSKDEAGKE